MSWRVQPWTLWESRRGPAGPLDPLDPPLESGPFLDPRDPRDPRRVGVHVSRPVAVPRIVPQCVCVSNNSLTHSRRHTRLSCTFDRLQAHWVSVCVCVCRRSRQEASVDRSRFEPVDQRISGRKIRSDRTHATRPSPASRPRSGQELPSAAHRLTTACHQGMPTRPSRDCGRHQGMPTRPTPCLRALETRLSARGSRGRGRCPHRTRGCARSARGSARSRGVPRGRRCRWAPRQ